MRKRNIVINSDDWRSRDLRRSRSAGSCRLRRGQRPKQSSLRPFSENWMSFGDLFCQIRRQSPSCRLPNQNQRAGTAHVQPKPTVTTRDRKCLSRGETFRQHRPPRPRHCRGGRQTIGTRTRAADIPAQEKRSVVVKDQRSADFREQRRPVCRHDDLQRPGVGNRHRPVNPPGTGQRLNRQRRTANHNHFCRRSDMKRLRTCRTATRRRPPEPLPVQIGLGPEQIVLRECFGIVNGFGDGIAADGTVSINEASSPLTRKDVAPGPGQANP